MLASPLLGARVHADQHVLEHAHLVEAALVLEGARDAERGDPVRRQPGQLVLSVGEQDLAPGRWMQAGDGVEKGGLAGAVRPDQAENLALGHGQVDVAKGLQTAKALRQSAGLEQGHGAARAVGGSATSG